MSRSAKTCPQCGAKNPSMSTGDYVATAILGLVLFGWLVIACGDVDVSKLLSDLTGNSDTAATSYVRPSWSTTTSLPIFTTTSTSRSSPRRTTTTVTSASLTTAESKYLTTLWDIHRELQDLALHLQTINGAWENRVWTLSETDEALEEAIADTDRIIARFEQLTASSGASNVHGQIGSTLDRIVNGTRDMLTGLRSTDTGEARTQALEAVVEATREVEIDINRARQILLRSGSPTTTRARTTTTRARTTTTALTILEQFEQGRGAVACRTGRHPRTCTTTRVRHMRPDHH